MNIWILVAAPMLVVALPAQAHQAKAHHGKHHHAAKSAMPYPDSVTLDGKEYKVCKAGIQDDCVQPREAGLGFGNRPTDVYRPEKSDRHR